MATIRKLQAEIDKTFRKVDEQQEVFQQIFDRLKECDSSLKEKYEVLLFTDCIFHFVPPRNLYNCKIVSLIAFLFTRFKEEKREKKDSFQERERFFPRRAFCPSLFLRARWERGKERIYWYVIGFPPIVENWILFFPERGAKTSIFLLFLDVRMTLTQFYSYSYY